MTYEEKQAVIKIVDSNNIIKDVVNPIPTVPTSGITPLTIIPDSLKVEIYEVAPDMEKALINFKYYAVAFYTDSNKPVPTKYKAEYDGAITGIKLEGLYNSYSILPTVITDSTKNSAVIDTSGAAPTIKFTISYIITYCKANEQLVKISVDPVI